MSGALAANPVSGSPSPTWRTAELLCALSYGSGLAGVDRMEHGTNTAFVGMQLAVALGLGAADREAVFYGALLKDAGCGACGAVLAPFVADDERAPRLDLVLVDLHSPRSMATWATRGLRFDSSLPAKLARLTAFAAKSGSVVHEAMAAHCEIAADFTTGLGFGRHVRDAVLYQHEHYDGHGPAFHRRADAIPAAAQVLHLALAADLARGLAGPDAAAAMVRQRAGGSFDPRVAEAYLDVADSWPSGDEPVPLGDVLVCDPGTPVDALPGDRRLAVCEALADFVDLKSVRHGAHSHTVADLAARAGACLGLSASEQEQVRRAALVHDLGKTAVPYRMLDKAGDDTDVPRRPKGAVAVPEPIRLHPYYAQGILSRIPPLADVAADVGTHHERLDGSGYPLGLVAEGMPMTARVLAAADVWAERRQRGVADLDGMDGLDADCLAALRSCGESRSKHHHWTSPPEAARKPLTSRELEVLRLLADGASNPEISRTLYISRRTAEHHVEHILAKLDVSSRTAAVAHALTHELLS
jgi:HD-GYP domain-containing protein (c-di-GMP phosphodiesterase class II)/DNA-binding CsgD family transcriptional regulator